MSSSNIDSFYQTLTEQPDWYFWEIRNNNAVFIEMDAQSYRDSIFTDSRIASHSAKSLHLDESQLYQILSENPQAPRKANYIFHVAHCGSTLLARSFDFLNSTLVYREPKVLRQLGCSKPATDPALFKSRLDCACRLLTRTFEPAHIPVIKANVPVNFILPDLINSPVHDVSGVLLYQTLDIYLLNLYKNQERRRQWINKVVEQLATPISQRVGLANEALIELPVEQKLILLWFAQMQCYQEALNTSSQMMSLNSEDFFADPTSTLANIASHFSISLDPEQISGIVNGELYKSYSKSRERKPFNNELRLKQQQKLKEKHQRAIDTHLDWFYKTFGNLPVLSSSTAPSL
jgi:hypothetical protein